MPLMMLMALMILCGCCVLFSKSTDLHHLSEVVLMADSTAKDWTFDKDENEWRDSEPFWMVSTFLGEDKDSSDLLAVKGKMQRSDDYATGGSVSRDSVSGLLSVKETMQDGCIVEDDDWEFWGVAIYRREDSKCYIWYNRCLWPQCDEEDTVRADARHCA